MSLESKAKTLVQITRENCRELKNYCGNCVAPCEFEGTPTFKGKWISLSDYIVERAEKDARLEHLETMVEAANKILDDAEHEKLTGEHVIFWADWQKLRAILAVEVPRNREQSTETLRDVPLLSPSARSLSLGEEKLSAKVLNLGVRDNSVSPRKEESEK